MNKFKEWCTPEEIDFLYRFVTYTITGNITHQNFNEWYKAEMLLTLSDKVREDGCDCNWKGLYNKMQKIVEKTKPEVIEAYNLKNKPKRGRKSKENK